MWPPKCSMGNVSIQSACVTLGLWFSLCRQPHEHAHPSSIFADDAKCDVWSVGVIAFMLLSGASPFNGSTDAELFSAIRAAQFRFEDSLLNAVSAEAREFIRLCLTKRVSKRFTAADALKHRWFALLKTQTVEVPPSPMLLQRFRAFIVRSWLAKIFIDVLSHTLPPTSIVDLRAQFNRYDLSGSGQISIEDLRSITRGYAKGVQYSPVNSTNNSANNSPMKPFIIQTGTKSTINTNKNNITTYNTTHDAKNGDGDISAASSISTCNSDNIHNVDHQEEFLVSVFRNMDIDQTGTVSI